MSKLEINGRCVEIKGEKRSGTVKAFNGPLALVHFDGDDNPEYIRADKLKPSPALRDEPRDAEESAQE